MNKTTEALKLAEEALSSWRGDGLYINRNWTDNDEKALAAIREVLAEPVKQELVGMPEPLEHPPLYPDENAEEQMRAYHYRTGWNECLEKCTSAISSLQNQEPVKQELNWGANKFMPHEQPVKQEPVAIVVSKYGDPESFGERRLEVLIDIQALPYDTPFYAAPVERQWVDLTDDEIFKLGKEKKFPDTDPVYFASAAIAAFKEKNK